MPGFTRPSSIRPSKPGARRGIASRQFPRALFAGLLLLLVAAAETRGIPESYRVQGTVCPHPDSDPLVPDGWVEYRLPAGMIPKSASAARVKGYILFSKHYQERIFPHTVPDEDDLRSELQCFLTQDEFEPVTFCVRPLKDLAGANVTVDDLVGPNGARIAAANIDVRVVRYLPKKRADKLYQLFPAPLEKRETVDLKAGETRQFWLTVYAPGNAVPGMYGAGIHFRCRNAPSSSLKLRVRVLPFKLEKPKIPLGMYWRIDKRMDGMFWGETRKETLAKVRADMIIMRDHGLNAIDLYGSTCPGLSMKNGKLHMDYTTTTHPSFNPVGYATFIRTGLETGLFSPHIPIPAHAAGRPIYAIDDALKGHGDFPDYSKNAQKRNPDGIRFTADFDRVYKAIIRELLRLGRTENWPPMAMMPVDEIGNSKTRKIIAAHFLKLIREVGGTTALTLNNLHREPTRDDAERPDIKPYLDVRIYNYVDQSNIDATARAGDTLWLYNCGAGHWRPGIARSAFGLLLLRTRARGYLEWAWQSHAGWGTTPWRVGPRGTGWYFSYPAPDGSIPTIGLAGVREGIDDYRYFQTLSALIRAADRRRDPALRAAAATARTVADEIVGQVPLRKDEHSSPGSTGFGDTPGPTFDIWRTKIAKQILHLRGLGLEVSR